MEQIMGMLPGMKGMNVKDAKIDENQIDRMEAMILSMTPKEREKPDIINGSRKKRIAAGSGTTVEELNRFIKQFEQTQKLMKQFTGGGMKKKRGLFGKGFPF
jgi:signal recognition particle subunit SRP54